MSAQGAHPQITVSTAPGAGEQLLARFGSPDHEAVFRLIQKISTAHDHSRSSPATGYPLFDSGEYTIDTDGGCIRVPWVRFIHEAWLAERPDVKAVLKDDFGNVDTVPVPSENRTILVESCSRVEPAPVRAENLLREIALAGIGRPSTFGQILASLLKHSIEINAAGGCQVTQKGEELLRCIDEAVNKETVILDEDFVAQLDAKLDAIAAGSLNSAEVADAVLRSLCGDKPNFRWIEELGFAGETFEQYTARVAEAHAAVPVTLRAMPGLPAHLDPELVVPKDSPLRRFRHTLEVQLGNTIQEWSELSAASRSAYRLVAIAADRHGDCHALLTQSRFDLLLRWIAGLSTEGPDPTPQLVEDAKRRWSGLVWTKLDWPPDVEVA